MDYEDFHLEIESVDDGYRLRGVAPHRDDVVVPFELPFASDLALENELAKVELAVLKGTGRRRSQTVDVDTIRDFGRLLFDSVMTGRIAEVYYDARERAVENEAGLRIRLVVEPPELASIPWELLYDSRQEDFVALSRRTPLVRHLRVAQPTPSMTIKAPLRLLAMVSSPRGVPGLKVDAEKQRITEALAPLQERGLVELHWTEGGSWRALQEQMRHGPWHVFHFIGHGDFDAKHGEGVLVVEDDEGGPLRLDSTELVRLIADHPTLRLVVLNACEGATADDHDAFSSNAAALVRRNLPAVLAMQYEITDTAAIEFSRSFYGAIADGLPIDVAVSDARVSMSIGTKQSLEWATPVLFMRAAEGALFDVTQPSAGPMPPQRAEPEPKAATRSEPPSRDPMPRSLKWALVVAPIAAIAIVLAIWASGGNSSTTTTEAAQATVTTAATTTAATDGGATTTAAPDDGATTTADTTATTTTEAPPSTTLPDTVDPSGPDVASFGGFGVVNTASLVAPLAASPIGLLVAQSTGGRVVLWDLEVGTEAHALNPGAATIVEAAFSPNGQYVATGDADGAVVLWDVSSGAEVARSAVNVGGVGALAFSTDGTLLAASSDTPFSGTVSVFEIDDLTSRATVEPQGLFVIDLAMQPDSEQLVVLAGMEGLGDLSLWRATDGAEIGRFFDDLTVATAIAFTADPTVAATGTEDGEVIFYNVVSRRGTGLVLSDLQVPDCYLDSFQSRNCGAVRALAFSPDGSLVAAGSIRGRVFVWNAATGALLQDLAGHDDEMTLLRFRYSATGLELISADNDTVIVWEAALADQG